MISHFLDSNICVYAFTTSFPSKKEIAKQLLLNGFTISSPVIIETYNAISRKYKIPDRECEVGVEMLLSITEKFETLTSETVKNALDVKRRYRFSFLDSLIIAAALQGGCNTLYSEDMQHGVVVNDSLTIINPFIGSF